MSDTAIKNALARRAALAREIEICEERIADAKAALQEVAAFIQGWLKYADEDDRQLVGIESVSHVLDTTPPGKQSPNPPRTAVADRVREIIRTRGHPMSRHEIYKALADGGMVIEGKDPEMVLSTMLWRSKDVIVRLGTKGYWLQEVAYPPYGYDPEFPETAMDPKRTPQDQAGPPAGRLI